MAATSAPLAGLEIRHGHRWGYSKSGESSVYIDRDQEIGAVLFIEDGGVTQQVNLSQDGSTALLAAVIASRCPHHCASHTPEVGSDAAEGH